jgi:hypothetical protein
MILIVFTTDHQSASGRVYKAGSVIELEDDIAEELIALGVAQYRARRTPENKSSEGEHDGD